jgi:hypothetical protein
LGMGRRARRRDIGNGPIPCTQGLGDRGAVGAGGEAAGEAGGEPGILLAGTAEELDITGGLGAEFRVHRDRIGMP